MEQLSGKKIGILGGSFDPVHNGHLAIAQSAYTDFSLDEVWFIPAGHSPNKEESHMTNAGVRAEMTQLAISDHPYFRVSEIEINASETSYTYLTLTKLKSRYPDTEFYFIMGADSLDYFEKWRHPEIICEKATILVAVREQLALTDIMDKIEKIRQLFPAEIYPLSCPRTDISSSNLREMIADGKDVSDLLPKAVYQYIQKNRLYLPFCKNVSE